MLLLVVLVVSEGIKDKSVFSSVPEVPDFVKKTDWKAIWGAARDASVATWETLRLWGVFIVLFSRPIVQCIGVITEALLPHAKRGLWWIWSYLRRQQPIVLLQLGCLLALLIVGYRQGYFAKSKQAYSRCESTIRVQYRSFIASIQAKSRAVALIVPHFLYWLFILAINLMIREPFTSIYANETILLILTTWIPVIQSGRLLFQLHSSRQVAKNPTPPRTTPSAGTPNSTRRRKKRAEVPQTAPAAVVTSLPIEYPELEEGLKYWIIWGLFSSAIGFASLFITSRMAQYLYIPHRVSVSVLIWMHLPWTNGTMLLYSIISPMIHPYANRIPEPEPDDRTNLLFRTLSLTRLVPDLYVNAIRDVWAQGPAMIGFIFIFTPGFITARGCLLVGMAFPAYISIGVLTTAEKRNMPWWTTYFLVLACVEYLVEAIGAAFSWVPLFYHMKLISIFWLQFPYFRGAQRLFDLFMMIFTKPKQD